MFYASCFLVLTPHFYKFTFPDFKLLIEALYQTIALRPHISHIQFSNEKSFKIFTQTHFHRTLVFHLHLLKPPPCLSHFALLLKAALYFSYPSHYIFSLPSETSFSIPCSFSSTILKASTHFSAATNCILVCFLHKLDERYDSHHFFSLPQC